MGGVEAHKFGIQQGLELAKKNIESPNGQLLHNLMSSENGLTQTSQTTQTSTQPSSPHSTSRGDSVTSNRRVYIQGIGNVDVYETKEPGFLELLLGTGERVYVNLPGYTQEQLINLSAGQTLNFASAPEAGSWQEIYEQYKNSPTKLGRFIESKAFRNYTKTQQAVYSKAYRKLLNQSKQDWQRRTTTSSKVYKQRAPNNEKKEEAKQRLLDNIDSLEHQIRAEGLVLEAYAKRIKAMYKGSAGYGRLVAELKKRTGIRNDLYHKLNNAKRLLRNYR